MLGAERIVFNGVYCIFTNIFIEMGPLLFELKIPGFNNLLILQVFRFGIIIGHYSVFRYFGRLIKSRV